MLSNSYLFRVICLALAGVIVAGSGCGPSGAHTTLRKENQQLQAEVAQLKRLREGDLARIRGLEGSGGAGPATRPMLPQHELDRLYTAHGLSFGRLTGGYRDDPKSVEDDGVAVYVVPTDEDGQTLKAAGSFVISVYDLATPDKALLVTRKFSLDESRKRWFGGAMLFNYVLKLPFDKQPTHRELMIHVEFTDQLTGRVIASEKQVSVGLAS